jgi:hypothetical protein
MSPIFINGFSSVCSVPAAHPDYKLRFNLPILEKLAFRMFYMLPYSTAINLLIITHILNTFFKFILQREILELKCSK